MHQPSKSGFDRGFAPGYHVPPSRPMPYLSAARPTDDAYQNPSCRRHRLDTGRAKIEPNVDS
jgi:hypothetical protein